MVQEDLTVYRKVADKIQGLEVSMVLPKLLQKMLTPEQAKLAAEFPGTPEELAEKVGRDLKSVNKDLQYMYEMGLGTRSARSGKWNLPRIMSCCLTRLVPTMQSSSLFLALTILTYGTSLSRR